MLKHVPLVIALLATGCVAPGGMAPNTVNGETQSVYGAPVSTWATLNADGSVNEVGATLPLAAVTSAPTDRATPPFSTAIRFPEVVRTTTFIDHLGLDYAASGHPPEGLYTVPHFDMHFYRMTPDEVKAIDCKDETLPAAELVPANYALLPPPKGECVPLMGYHALDTTSPELRPESPEPFSKHFVFGYYGGRLTFLEPMLTRDYLLTKESYTVNVPKPARIGVATRYPSTFRATYDASTDAYQLVFSGFAAAE